MTTRSAIRAFLLSVLLGGAATLTLSWSIAIYYFLAAPRWPTSIQPIPREWPFDAPSTWPLSPLDANASRSPGVTDALYEYTSTALTPASPVTHDFRVEVLQVGWPFRAMASAHRFEKRTDGNVKVTTVADHLWSIEVSSIKTSFLATLRLPTRVLPVGFVANSLIFATVLACCFLACQAFRRRHRTKRGQCVSCKYQMGALPSCPECGTPSPIQVANSQSTP